MLAGEEGWRRVLAVKPWLGTLKEPTELPKLSVDVPDASLVLSGFTDFPPSRRETIYVTPKMAQSYTLQRHWALFMIEKHIRRDSIMGTPMILFQWQYIPIWILLQPAKLVKIQESTCGTR